MNATGVSMDYSMGESDMLLSAIEYKNLIEPFRIRPLEIHYTDSVNKVKAEYY